MKPVRLNLFFAMLFALASLPWSAQASDTPAPQGGNLFLKVKPKLTAQSLVKARFKNIAIIAYEKGGRVVKFADGSATPLAAATRGLFAQATTPELHGYLNDVGQYLRELAGSGKLGTVFTSTGRLTDSALAGFLDAYGYKLRPDYLHDLVTVREDFVTGIYVMTDLYVMFDISAMGLMAEVNSAIDTMFDMGVVYGTTTTTTTYSDGTKVTTFTSDLQAGAENSGSVFERTDYPDGSNTYEKVQDRDTDNDGIVNGSDPDADNDGKPNSEDDDDDNDGTPDSQDTHPRDGSRNIWDRSEGGVPMLTDDLLDLLTSMHAELANEFLTESFHELANQYVIVNFTNEQMARHVSLVLQDVKNNLLNGYMQSYEVAPSETLSSLIETTRNLNFKVNGVWIKMN